MRTCPQSGLGQEGTSGQHPEIPSSGSWPTPLLLGGEKLPGTKTHQVDPLRLFNPRLGSFGIKFGAKTAGFLALGKGFAHKHQGVESSSRGSEKPGKTRRQGAHHGGQSGGLSLLEKGGWKTPTFQFHPKAFFALVHAKQNHLDPKLGQIGGNVGRRVEPLVLRQRGLHPRRPVFPGSFADFQQTRVYPKGRHVRQSGQQKTRAICEQMAASSGFRSERSRVLFGGARFPGGVRQSALDLDSEMVAEISGQPAGGVFDGDSILGWDNLVAPVNSIASSGDPGHFDKPTVGAFPELPGPGHASYKMAPPLCQVVREALQRKQVSSENITLYLSKFKDFGRYDKAFRSLWAFCLEGGDDPNTLSIEGGAGWLLKLAQVKPNEARNAYSALLLVPGWESLKFSPLIKKCKTLWSISVPKYADFWDAKSVIIKLRGQFLDWNSIAQVRDRCNLVLRFLHLCRSIDLAQLHRRKARFNGRFYIWIQRKGRRRPQF